MAVVIGVEIPDGQLAQLAAAGFDRVPEAIDAAGVGYVVLGADRADGIPGASLSPTMVATVFGRRTTGLGIVAAASPQRDHPFNVARRLASLDHLTHGRAGWLALRQDRAAALGLDGRGGWAPGPSDAPRLADAVTAARALWRTWPIESLRTGDTGVPDTTPVRYADHTGFFSTTGPLNVPTTPQGEPVVWWRYEPGDDPRDVGSADIVIVAPEHLAAVAELPESVRVHVRLDRSDPGLRSRITESAANPRVHGVLVRADLFDLRGFLSGPLTTLARSGIVRLRTDHGGIHSGTTRPGARPTLREYLRTPRRVEPDLSRHRPVFAGS
ncbi:LLM class flavin-dependent oxidoreductase [Nocardia noduli]|uniref:LLM class flavin-dependent oxidoreductase n=1 Tax=Nocardia noduli TaxID=2815722 RepID=UPI001C22FAFD|nr:LLM class flavin-dependent oxidoreductase [Nocardia noduli]